MNKFILTCLLTTGVITVTHAADKHAEDGLLINMENCKDNTRDVAALSRIKSLCEIEFPSDVKKIIRDRDIQCANKYVYVDTLFQNIISNENKRLNDLYLKNEKLFCSNVPAYIEQIRQSTGQYK